MNEAINTAAISSELASEADGREQTERERNKPSVAGEVRSRIRFGVAFRLLGALLAITMFAIGASLAALYAFNQYRKGFDQIASSNLPAGCCGEPLRASGGRRGAARPARGDRGDQD
jgi:hypothetical protein